VNLLSCYGNIWNQNNAIVKTPRQCSTFVEWYDVVRRGPAIIKINGRAVIAGNESMVKGIYSSLISPNTHEATFVSLSEGSDISSRFGALVLVVDGIPIRSVTLGTAINGGLFVTINPAHINSKAIILKKKPAVKISGY
jgi:hypothetical protein